MMTKETLLAVNAERDILPQWRGTPVGDLLAYHNLGREPRAYERPELLVGMCIDYRKSLRMPDNFAFVLRAGGANFRRVEFKISFAVAVGGVRVVALIGHDDCGMVGLTARREAFINGLVSVGWTREDAEKHFDANAPSFEIDDPATFVKTEAQRLRVRYPKLTIAPLLYLVTDGRLVQIQE